MPRSSIVAVVAAAALGVLIGFYLARSHPAGADRVGAPAPALATDGRRILYWRDPMRPEVKFDHPGKSPFMDMELEPVYAPSSVPSNVSSNSVLQLDGQVVQNTSVRTEAAVLGHLQSEIRAFGSVVADERLRAVVQARADGYVRRLAVRVPSTSVKAGEPLVEVVFPIWSAAFREYLLVRHNAGLDAAVKSGARDRLVQLGIPPELITDVENSNSWDGTITLRAPRAGTVTQIPVVDGSALTNGTVLFQIVGLDSVWLMAEVPESRAAALGAGMPVTARVPASSGSVITGQVAAVLDTVDPVSRERGVRVILPNSKHALVPGMSGSVTFTATSATQHVLIPEEAIVSDGRDNRVFVALGQGRFEIRQVQLGAAGGGKAEVLTGLSQGEAVVTSGQFLLDAEADLEGAAHRLGDNGPTR